MILLKAMIQIYLPNLLLVSKQFNNDFLKILIKIKLNRIDK